MGSKDADRCAPVSTGGAASEAEWASGRGEMSDMVQLRGMT